jgi:hypothetical protein
MERIAGPFEGFALLKLLSKTGIKNFNQHVAHTGIDKYIAGQ